MDKIKAFELSLGDRIRHENGLCYEVRDIGENKSGKIKVLLYPYQNSMSASKRITLNEMQELTRANV